jgi:hypothetical protein
MRYNTEVSAALTRLFSEVVDGAGRQTGAFILNSGDLGLLRSLENISPADASTSVNDGATIAAHTQHVRYGLSLMNRWASEGGDPFADATWDAAWNTSRCDLGRGVEHVPRRRVRLGGDSRWATRRSASLGRGAELSA